MSVDSPTGNKLRVVPADNYPLFLEGIVRSLRDHPNIAVVASYDRPSPVVAAIKDLRPDLLLMSQSLATQLRDADRHAAAELAPRPRIILVAEEHANVRLIAGSLRASGVLRRTDSMETFLRAMAVVASGQTWVSEDLPRQKPSVLSRREREISLLVSQGLSNREIGNRLELSEQSVKNHVSRILRKLGLNNRVQVALQSWAE